MIHGGPVPKRSQLTAQVGPHKGPGSMYRSRLSQVFQIVMD